MSPCISSNLPGNSADHALCSPIWSCSEWGLPCHKWLPIARCALTAPFHPYQQLNESAAGGLFSAALSVGFHPPGVTWHSVLRSPDFPPRTIRILSGAIAWPTPGRDFTLLPGSSCTYKEACLKSAAIELLHRDTEDTEKSLYVLQGGQFPASQQVYWLYSVGHCPTYTYCKSSSLSYGH